MNDARKNPGEETSGEKVIEPGERIEDPQLRAHLLKWLTALQRSPPGSLFERKWPRKLQLKRKLPCSFRDLWVITTCSFVAFVVFFVYTLFW